MVERDCRRILAFHKKKSQFNKGANDQALFYQNVCLVPFYMLFVEIIFATENIINYRRKV